MTGLRLWRSDGNSIHDLSHISSLSDVPGIVLYVSERSLYVLQNLVAAEASFAARYATTISAAGYVPVTEEDEDWPLFQGVVNNLGLEVIKVAGWQPWSLPIVKQNGVVCSIDPTGSRFWSDGELAHVSLVATIATGAGEAGNIQIQGLEDIFRPAALGYRCLGSCICLDALIKYFPAFVYYDGPQGFILVAPNGYLLGSALAPFTLGVNDMVTFTATYQVA